MPGDIGICIPTQNLTVIGTGNFTSTLYVGSCIGCTPASVAVG